MPDALSKTIPIWCSVLNRVLFPDDDDDDDDKPLDSSSHHRNALHTPPQAVSNSEHAQIAARLDDFAQSFAELGIDIARLRGYISKPLRPIWVTPESVLDATTATDQVFSDYHPIICCTASRRVAGGEVSEGGYIQGSGDDTENWACGLTPPVFWANRELLLSTPESELPDAIAGLVSSGRASSAAGMSGPTSLMPVPPTSSLYVVSLAALSALPPGGGGKDIIIALGSETTAIGTDPTTTTTATTSPQNRSGGQHTSNSNRLEINLGPGKIGSRNLRSSLPQIMDFVKKSLHSASTSTQPDQEPPAHPPQQQPNIILACRDAKDLSIGAALAILCALYGENGDPRRRHVDVGAIDKTYIRRRLGWIMTAMPESNPSRATLQSVNSYLMGRPG